MRQNGRSDGECIRIPVGAIVGRLGEAFNGLQVLIVTYAFSVIGAILILIVGWSISRLLGRWVKSLLTRSHRVDPTVVGFFSVFVRYAVLVVVVIMVLGQFGVQTASIITALGAAGLAIGLALQGTLQNIAAGIMLLVLRPFRVGEYIDADGVSGTIEEIGLFATELKNTRRPVPDGAELAALECSCDKLLASA
jgi:small conductance mechanosensitive channel